MTLRLTATFKAILIVSLIAVGLVSGSYYYIQVNSKGVASSPPALKPAEFFVDNLTVNPSEASINQPVVISVNVQNVGEQIGNYSADLWINGALTNSKSLTLSGGQTSTVDFTISEPNPGTYSLYVGNLTETLKIDAPSPTSRPASTPTYTTPPILGGSGSGSSGGGSSGGGAGGGSRSWTSCPSLLVWNGTGYMHASEVSDGPGWLGFVDYYKADGSIVFGYSDPWSYMKLNSSILRPLNGFYDMTVTEQSDEIFFLDSVKLLAVDHSPNVDVYSTRGTYLYNLSYQGTIYTVSENLASPISALNNEENVLPQISKLDRNSTTATRWAWNTLELNLGNLTGAQQIKLVVNAQTNWPTNEAGGNWASQFANQPGVTPSPPPYMEVKDANGNWVQVPSNREFPIPPVDPTTFAVNLTGLFQTNDYSLRICYYQDYTFDYVGVDTSAQQNVSVREISPSSAILSQDFETNSNSSGTFTQYGDVTGLVLSADDMYVVGRQGDSVQLKFADQTPVPEGMVRDYFVVASAWFKGQGLPYVPFTVDSLPFHNMTGYPYSSNETYPNDAAHSSYLLQYNNRTIIEQAAVAASISGNEAYNEVNSLELLAVLLGFTILIVSAGLVSVHRRKK